MLMFLKERWMVLAAVALCASQLPVAAQAPPPRPQGSIAIVVDTSSMSRRQFDNVRSAVDAFLAPFSGDNDELALFAAGEKPTLLQNFTADAPRLSERLDTVAPGGRAAIYETIDTAAQHVRDEAGNERGAVVVFVAGPANGEAPQQPAGQRDANIEVDVVTVPGADWRSQQSLQKLAASSGGAAYFPADENQLREIASVLGRRMSSESSLPANPHLNAHKPLSGYRRAVVQPIKVSPDKRSDTPAGEEMVLQQVLLARLRNDKVFDEVIPSSNAGTDNLRPEPDTVVIMPTLLDYRRGSRMQRQFVGWRGEARYRLQLSLFDTVSRKPVLAVVEQGSSASGFLGGSQEEVHAKAVKRVVDRLVSDLKRAK